MRAAQATRFRRKTSSGRQGPCAAQPRARQRHPCLSSRSGAAAPSARPIRGAIVFSVFDDRGVAFGPASQHLKFAGRGSPSSISEQLACAPIPLQQKHCPATARADANDPFRSRRRSSRAALHLSRGAEARTMRASSSKSARCCSKSHREHRLETAREREEITENGSLITLNRLSIAPSRRRAMRPRI